MKSPEKPKILITGGSGFIGTNLIEFLSKNEKSILNLDKSKPSNKQHIVFWKKCNIMNFNELNNFFQKYEPTHVVHLAARTETSSNLIEDYEENTKGTLNVIKAINNTSSIIKSVITSTQYVYRSLKNPLPLNDLDYMPHTVYGLSKKISEDYTRNYLKQGSWTIIRPTNIWGPWNYNYPNGLYKAIEKGLYFNPSKMTAYKSYGFVLNIVDQIFSILFADLNITDSQVFYVGEEPMYSKKWVSQTYFHLRGSYPLSVPNFILIIGAYFGDFLKYFGIKFPLTSLRLSNMLESYYVPIDKTINLFGLNFTDLDENLKITMKWYSNYKKEKYKY